ncbi:CLUMA_CG012810, isoform A [Clunio marinus]|uniref:CLUMA_CG012810, isoform A n=1 Tax=Clunio marinus TaxID=568069 RepID=A0A1J1IGZ5_9DIPT|nr:CLUMA_CG012810, isoform A [Clunio marinus]
MKLLGAYQRLKPYVERELGLCLKVEHRFVCSFCFEICSTINRLSQHYAIHGYFSEPKESNLVVGEKLERKTSNPPSKICSICTLSFKSAKTLSKHIKSVHHKLKSFMCTICSKNFSRKAALDIHLRQHSSDESAKILACVHPQCTFKAFDPSVLSKHKKIHIKSNKGKYACLADDCDYYAIQATGLKNHVLSKHPQLYETMKCSYPQCKFVSVNSERLAKHMNDHEKGLLDINEESQRNEESRNAALHSNIEAMI